MTYTVCASRAYLLYSKSFFLMSRRLTAPYLQNGIHVERGAYLGGTPEERPDSNAHNGRQEEVALVPPPSKDPAPPQSNVSTGPMRRAECSSAE